ncbi:cupin domain-containing protein [Streptomyces sp. NPDC002044]|uniref:cupin domain-containing protein n=1 Tax=Streptomyces sp. NPDC002044 TaxID=3154662 RepID=UPI0033299DED
MGGRQTRVRSAGARVAPEPAGREVVIAPGGCTGWHYHRVPLNAVVRAGTLTRVLHDRSVVVHRAGTAFVEPAGADHVHLGHNLGSEPVVLYVTPGLRTAAGAPFAIATPAPRGATRAVCRDHAP